MAEELKPCPFCGGTEAFVERLDYSAAYVQCDSLIDEHSACLARGPVGVQDDDGEDIPGAAAAIRAWNAQAASRATPPSPSTAASDALRDIASNGGSPGATARAALQVISSLTPACKSAPSTAEDELDVRYEFERWMSQRGEAATYIGDGLYSSGAVCDQAEAFAAGVAIARAALSANAADREAKEFGVRAEARNET